jgi:hypothetical protein
MLGDEALRREFTEWAAANPDVAADPDARLAWFPQQASYADASLLVYPIAREPRMPASR